MFGVLRGEIVKKIEHKYHKVVDMSTRLKVENAKDIGIVIFINGKAHVLLIADGKIQEQYYKVLESDLSWDDNDYLPFYSRETKTICITRLRCTELMKELYSRYMPGSIALGNIEDDCFRIIKTKSKYDLVNER